eukprot:1102107-Rhodomonas_salina.2
MDWYQDRKASFRASHARLPSSSTEVIRVMRCEVPRPTSGLQRLRSPSRSAQMRAACERATETREGLRKLETTSYRPCATLQMCVAVLVCLDKRDGRKPGDLCALFAQRKRATSRISDERSSIETCLTAAPYCP